MKIIDGLKDRFTEGDRTEWNEFFDKYPKKADDIPAERMQDFITGNFLPPCSIQLPDAGGLSNHRVCHPHGPVKLN
eukprot:5733178-Pleurochrysis_carterae.AAC.1